MNKNYFIIIFLHGVSRKKVKFILIYLNRDGPSIVEKKTQNNLITKRELYHPLVD